MIFFELGLLQYFNRPLPGKKEGKFWSTVNVLYSKLVSAQISQPAQEEWIIINSFSSVILAGNSIL